jgi:hypothetical protein
MAYLRDGKYWQQSIRRDGAATTRYLGKGEWGAARAEMEMVERGRTAAERIAAAEADDAARRLLAREEARGAATRRAVAVILEPMGLVRYSRNPWRRRAMRSIQGPRGKSPAPQRVAALMRRVRAGKEGALPELAALAKVHPKAVAEAAATDLVRCARGMLADLLAGRGRDKAASVAMEARLDVIEAELAPAGSGAATRLLAAVVAHCWAEHWAITAACSKLLGSTAPGDLRRQYAALRRYLAALRSYAQVERLEGTGRS